MTLTAHDTFLNKQKFKLMKEEKEEGSARATIIKKFLFVFCDFVLLTSSLGPFGQCIIVQLNQLWFLDFSRQRLFSSIFCIGPYVLVKEIKGL